jgi:hypothetical protein
MSIVIRLLISVVPQGFCKSFSVWKKANGLLEVLSGLVPASHLVAQEFG